MLKLMKLEIKKFKMSRYIKSVIIINIVLLVITMSIGLISKQEGDINFSSFSDAIIIIDTLVRNVYIIFASVLLSRLIIDEYKNNTITVLFMYPIKRKSLIISKLIIVSAFTFIFIILSDIFISSTFYGINTFANIVPSNLDLAVISKQSGSIVLNAIASAGMGLIPLYFGMRKKSVPATIVASIILVSLTGSNNNGFSLSSIIAIPLALGAIGVIIAYLTIRNIERTDIV